MKWLFYISFCCLTSLSYGQKAEILFRESQLRIGEQTTFVLSFEYSNPTGEILIAWPQFDDQLTEHIEILDRTVDFDEIIDSNYNVFNKKQEFTVTCFKPGIHYINPIGIEMDDSLYYSNPLQLLVQTVEVDTATGITDIKEIYSVDYSFGEQMEDWFKKYWPFLAGSAAIVAIFFLLRLIKNARPEKEIVLPPPIPAHITALKSLIELKNNQAWLMDNKKKYYSELTFTVRLYLEQRFGIQAIEHTTREIIQDLKYADISEDDKMYLRRILSEADMVKFAKMKPENKFGEESLHKSIDFVEKTKKESETSKTEESEELNNGE
jgi:hypothetical protein